FRKDNGAAITKVCARFVELCRRIGEMAADVLASFHMVNPDDVDLGDLGRPEGFVERQVAGWTKRWDAAVDKSSPDASAVIAWIEADIPTAQATTFVHNDYKLDNIMVARDDPARAVAVLDWDMCTRGDPLLDLANLVIYWSEESDSALWRMAVYIPTDKPGFPSRAELVERYAHKTGFDVSRFGWYEIFGTFKVAVILQQIYIRYLRGQTQDERFAILGQRVNALIRKCEELIARG
ncbi:MAG: phosphotransferase family protein, partial [Rhodospirillaceae bacterium]|nr:phosphotransferase family protein [Rhodospirillaceae bacterium]